MGHFVDGEDFSWELSKCEYCACPITVNGVVPRNSGAKQSNGVMVFPEVLYDIATSFYRIVWFGSGQFIERNDPFYDSMDVPCKPLVILTSILEQP
jgi:hypothetical protein